MSRPIVVTVCMFAPPNRGSIISAHIHGTHVPVEEPSTASDADFEPAVVAFPQDAGEVVGHLSEEIAMCVGLVQTHRAFAYNNAWANHRLLGACAELTQGGFEAERTGFFPSLQATLNHIYGIDLFYVDALEGGWLGPAAWENPIPFPALAELSEAQASMDRRLIGVCNALTPALLSGEVRINRGSHVQVERRDRLLMHLFQHQIHHRGQAHAMLSGTRIKPPQLDEFFSVAEAPLRAIEFDTLGWTEETVWGP